MLTRILSYLGLVPSPTTVDEAIAPLLEAQKGLQAVTNTRRTNAFQKTDLAERLLRDAEADTAEADRADRVLERLTALTEGA